MNWSLNFRIILIISSITFKTFSSILGGGLKIESKLNDNLKMYEKTIKEIRKRQELLEQSTSSGPSTSAAAYGQREERERSETPPPPPLKTSLPTSSTYVYKSINFGKHNTPAAPKPPPMEQPKFSFQIKKPVKVDKFGLIRLATPALQNSPTPSPPSTKRSSRSPRPRSRRRSRSHSRSLSRSRSRSRGFSRRRSSRSRSRSRNRSYSGRPRYRRHRSSSSNSRSRSRSRSTSNPRYRGRRPFSRGKSSHFRSTSRRSPSPFVPRGTPSPNTRYRRSRSPRFNRRSPRRYSRSPNRGYKPKPKFGNRTWQRPDFKPRIPPSATSTSSSSDGKWLHDKFDDKNDGPSIEEIDEIISKAQKERKQDIINRDKNILKKTNNW